MKWTYSGHEVDSTMGPIADVWDERHSSLIAAAPDLLSACEGMLKHIDDVLDDQDLSVRRAQLAAAIAKATGK